MTLFVIAVYVGGAAYIGPRKGWKAAITWPIALGIVLAAYVESEMKDLKP